MPLFAIVAYDKTDDEAPARRHAARTAHFERMTNGGRTEGYSLCR